MQSLLASLVIGMSVKDAAFKAGMSTARAEVKKTGQDFDRGADRMEGAIVRAARAIDAAAIRAVDSLTRMGEGVQRGGLLLTAGLTVPMGLMGHAAKDTASDFESAMNRVNAAMVNAKPEELEKLKAAALEMGPAVGRSAIEAADAIESLAKNGMSASAILGGGLKSALTLAVVGQTDLGKAADLTTDIVAQFGKSASDLPVIVDRVSGALDASKMNFDDYRLAAGQAGGLVGALGYSFEDFNTALAATAPLFESGSDAGTSFRAFLTSLNAKSEDAARVMKKLGLEFYNADGSARPLAEIADQLQKKLSSLSDRSKGVALDKLFGTDGARTALALMKLGFEGVEDARKAIGDVTADQKLAILLDGEAAATQRVASAWERLKISVGEAGLLQAYTAVKEAVAGTLDVVGSAPPAFFKLVVAAGLAAASIGPLTIAAVGLAKIVLPLLFLRLGPVALGLASIINPAGVVLRLLGGLALQMGAATVLGRLGASLIGVAGPVGLVITALTILVPLLMRSGQASEAAKQAGEKLAEANGKVADTAQLLATQEGKARDATLAKAKADRIAAVDAVKKARADLLAAQAATERARAESKPSLFGKIVGVATRGASGLGVLKTTGVADAEADQLQRAKNLQQAADTLAGWNTLIESTMSGPSGGKIDMDFDKPKKEKKGRDADRDEAKYQDELGRVRLEQLRANAELTQSVHARYDLAMAEIAEDRASFVRQNEADKGLTDAKRATLLAEKDKELATRREIAERERFTGLAEQDFSMARSRNEAEQELVRAQIDLADNAKDRLAGELRLLELQRQHEAASLELTLATKAAATEEWQAAFDRKARLDRDYAARADTIARQNEGPGARYMREVNRSAGAIREDIEALKVDALQGLNKDLTDAIMGTQKLGDAFANMGKRIIASLIDIAVQQQIIKPMARALFGEGGGDGEGGGGGLGGLFGAVTRLFTSPSPMTSPTYGGGRMTGGPIRADRWYTVGERGPEKFFPGVSGTVVPNQGRGDRPSAQVTIAPSALFDVIIDGRAANVAAPIAASSTTEGLSSVGRAQSWHARQTLG